MIKTVSMKEILICIFGFVVFINATPDDRYTDKYDSINIPEILTNRRLLIPYLMCILDQGKCSPEGKELKSHIKEAMENYCLKCTESQRKGSKTVIGHLINKETAYWEQLVAKYDPERKYMKKYEAELKTIIV